MPSSDDRRLPNHFSSFHHYHHRHRIAPHGSKPQPAYQEAKEQHEPVARRGAPAPEQKVSQCGGALRMLEGKEGIGTLV